jgi:hypothetical protein
MPGKLAPFVGFALTHGAFMTIFAMVCLSSCNHRPPDDWRSATVISDQSVEPDATPTAQLSFELTKDPNGRRFYFQQLISSSGKKCALVTKAALKAGLDEVIYGT